jgi:type IV pilus assembly protein PilE
MRSAKVRGFTLVEMMIVVAVVAILAAIALPSYQSHLRKSKRAEAQAFMMAFAARQQQLMVDTRAFGSSISAVGIPVPANVSASYTLSMPAPGTADFTLTLTPNADQASEKCGTLAIDQNGTKTAATAGCW